jgi:dTDP-4-dehydrorhamnose reductase
VFSGFRNTPWTVDAVAKPLSVYGKSKLAGERIITLENPDNSLIIRTAWLYSPYGKNFFKTILSKAIRENGSISVVNDQLGQPTNAKDLAIQVARVIENRTNSGIYHITNSGTATWFDFAVEIFKLNGSEIDRLKPVPSSEFETKARRPSYSALDNSKILESSLITMPSWQDSVKKSFPDIKIAVLKERLDEV